MRLVLENKHPKESCYIFTDLGAAGNVLVVWAGGWQLKRLDDQFLAFVGKNIISRTLKMHTIYSCVI